MSAIAAGAPSPGTWEIDSDHHERPMPPFLGERFCDVYTESFRYWMGKYGTSIETVESALIDDFPYYAIRPVGAPPESKGPPPTFVLKVLSRLHPELRARNRRAREVFETKAWRAEREEYVNEIHPKMVELCRSLSEVDLPTISDEQLMEHLDKCSDALAEVLSAHFRITGAHMVPVGDFLAHVRRWTGAPPSEALAALRGSSDASRGAEPELVRAAKALVEADRRLEPRGEDAGNYLAALAKEDGDVGAAVGAWLARAQVSTVSGHSFVDVTGRDVPDVLLRTLIQAMETQRVESRGRASADEAARSLRQRVPDAMRAAFDELLDEARLTYGLRDLRVEGVGCGLSKHAIVEVGRRLKERGLLHDANHALSLTRAQLKSLLGGASRPTADEAVQLHERFTGRTLRDVPAVVGPDPSPPPPTDAFPPGLRRVEEALWAYLEVMWAGEMSESKRKCGAQGEGTSLQGHGASKGVQRGTAKIVKSPQDFGRLEKGDILIAPITTPHYNVILPLLGGVVTDRGGILSHPAIVAREFGIPGVVGTKVATETIPDGALVEVDGAAGTVTVLQ